MITYKGRRHGTAAGGHAEPARKPRQTDRTACSEQLVEVQGTAEGEPFTRRQMDGLIDLAETGIKELFALQYEAISAWKAAVRSA